MDLSSEFIFPVSIHKYRLIGNKISVIPDDDIPEIHKRKIDQYKQQNQFFIADKTEQHNRHQNRITDKVIPDKAYHACIPQRQIREYRIQYQHIQ